MLKRIKREIAQTTLEYAVLIVVVIVALLSIQHYVRNAYEGKQKSVSDDISAEQYDTHNTIYTKNTETYSRTHEVSLNSGSITNLSDNETTKVNASSVTQTNP
ncbi:MAG: hypothetical protein NT079_04115 [Candidatus Omnitrophica bacterium]|nr:hypothetical protein [Candidatus Omnitrophota bacterium]